jgi:hypothetical protein
MRDTDKLIEGLSRDTKPVKPLAPPLLRAALLLTGMIGAMAAFAAFRGHVDETIAQLANPRFALELAGALIAGVGAIIAAVVLSIPGRSPAWTYLPIPGLALWLIGGGLECYRQVGELGYVPASLFASRDCFIFIVSIGLPSAAAVYLFVRRHLSAGAVRATTLAALGAALLAAALLQFIHAHGTNPVDFATHVAAVLLLTMLAVMLASATRHNV